MSTREKARNGQRGLTRLEIIIVVMVLASLTLFVVPVVSGAISSFRDQGKEGDIRNVEASLGRYRSDNGDVLPILGAANPTRALVDADGDGVIRVKVNTTFPDPTGFPADSTADVVCGDGSTTMADSLAQCFGALDLAGKLIPTYLNGAPRHSSEAVTAAADASGSTADLVITGADSSGNSIELYLDANITRGDGLQVWNVDRDGKVVLLKSDAEYGAS
ncbi:MAG: hypothetical protein HY680_04470 [Chloroflexi bacterium]|nr:hypothetical protein [Chloroflexota bacterium]